MSNILAGGLTRRSVVAGAAAGALGLRRPDQSHESKGTTATAATRSAILRATSAHISGLLTAGAVSITKLLSIGKTCFMLPGGDSGAVLNGLIAAGYTDIWLAGGAYYAKTGVVQPPYVSVRSARSPVIWYWQSQGIAWTWHAAAETDAPMGECLGLVIDLSGETGQSVGFDFGDLIAADIDVTVQNPKTSGDILARQADKTFYMEKSRIRLALNDNGQRGVTLFLAQVAGAASSTCSLARNDYDLFIDVDNPENCGVVFCDGAHAYGGTLRIRGNVIGSNAALPANPYSARNLPAVLTIAGTIPAGHPGAGGHSNLTAMHLDVDVETPAGYTNYQQTIVQGAPGNVLNGIGKLGFGGASGTFAGGTYQSGDLEFVGLAYGDKSICAYQPQGHPSFVETGPIQLNQVGVWQAGGNILLDTGRFFAITLDADLTVNIEGRGGQAPPNQPHWFTAVIEQAATGSPYTVDFPRPMASGATVTFSGNATYTGPANNGQVDRLLFFTTDGLHYHALVMSGL
jgi:hypothetical protein